MGSIPSEDIMRELDREAYASILRAVYVRPQQDSLTLDEFLAKAREQLGLTYEAHSEILSSVRTDIELIRQGKVVPDAGRKGGFGISGSVPPGHADAMLPSTTRERNLPIQDSEYIPHGDSSDGGGGRRVKQPRKKRKHGRLVSPMKKESKTRPIGAPGSSKARGRPSAPGAGVKVYSNNKQPSAPRPRSTRSGGIPDPNNFIGRTIWRYYPNEDESRPWVEGFLIDYDGVTNSYTILYDPNSNDPNAVECTETGFDFSVANPNEYVMGDIVDLVHQSGSRRVAERPEPANIPTAAPVAAPVAPAPNKRKRPVKIPVNEAPFPAAWFLTAIADANVDDLNTMLSMLERKEIEVRMNLEQIEKEEMLGGDWEKRAELEKKFTDLCVREAEIMAELDALRKEQ